ncbi:DUF4183 domain-containing protein [Cohnella cellulosilytica]|uniref:DUF4183 domain-containing protein n=1 Tax=Cohnella cellulosilytica TaxID=986710 RepID=A0ABW2F7V0_9BACL
MALTIFNIAVTVEATAETTSNPAVSKYYYVVPAPVTVTNAAPLVLAATSFFADTGDAATAFEAVATDNGYRTVYVNGIPQMDDLITLSTTTLTLTPEDGETIDLDLNTPIVLEIVNFDPATTVTVTT